MVVVVTGEEVESVEAAEEEESEEVAFAAAAREEETEAARTEDREIAIPVHGMEVSNRDREGPAVQSIHEEDWMGLQDAFPAQGVRAFRELWREDERGRLRRTFCPREFLTGVVCPPQEVILCRAKLAFPPPRG